MKLTFTERGERKGKMIYVHNKKREFLGIIFYHKKWECFVWGQEEQIIMPYDCLLQIIKKLKMLDDFKKKKWQ